MTLDLLKLDPYQMGAENQTQVLWKSNGGVIFLTPRTRFVIGAVLTLVVVSDTPFPSLSGT